MSPDTLLACSEASHMENWRKCNLTRFSPAKISTFQSVFANALLNVVSIIDFDRAYLS